MVIKERKQIFLDKINLDKGTSNIHLEKKRTPFLDCLLQVHYKVKFLRIFFSFFFQGHDTTSAATLFGLYCLALHKDIQ
uniref:Cytochrome P450 n=1 Tax=Rhodnius prolixus TaxID=13249 RepID=T1HPG0_RHOPR